jgi:hypothetical protein
MLLSLLLYDVGDEEGEEGDEGEGEGDEARTNDDKYLRGSFDLK